MGFDCIAPKQKYKQYALKKIQYEGA